MNFKLGELFCGPGGIAFGAHHADIGDPNWKISHQWATDWDSDSVATYISNIPEATEESVILSDIRALDYQRLSDLGEIDGLAFGFPCNDYSMVGSRRGLNGEFGPLYTYGKKALKDFKPKWFLAENVSGLHNSNEGIAFKQILRELKSVGYNLVPHLYKFEEYGLPQARHRIIIIGIRNDLNVEYKVPSTEGYTRMSAEQALQDIPIDAQGHEFTRQAEHIVERLKFIPEGKNIWYIQDATDNKRLLEGELPIPDEYRLKPSRTLSNIYKRLDRNKPAYTVTGSGGGGTHMYHWSENRALTNRERARLQTFRNDYVFKGSKESQRKQIGMAVPPEGAQIIFEALLRSFKGEDYPSIPAYFTEEGERNYPSLFKQSTVF